MCIDATALGGTTGLKRFFCVLLILVLLVGAEFFISNYTVGVTQYTVAIEKMPKVFEGYKVLQITDMHSKKFPFNDMQLLYKIKKISPNIIVMTGDMINTTDTDFEHFISLSKRLAKQYPVYYIIGNHEQALKKNDLVELKTRLADAGVFILDNRHVKLMYNGASINLYGLWFNLRYYRDINDEQAKDYIVSEKQMKKILGQVKHDEVNILLAHNPVFFEAYAQWGADLTLSGHMHGGMIRIPFYGGVLSPEKEYFPQYDAGIFRKGKQEMIVSRGLGEYAGFRYFNQPELIVISLTNKST